MNEREGFSARQEAMREAAGQTSKMTREHVWEGLTKYLTAELRHARRAAPAKETASEEKDQSRRSR